MSESSESLRERLDKGAVLVAEGYIFELERRGYVKAGPFVPEVVTRFPEALEQLHTEFARAGSDIIVACTYYAHRAKLRATGKEKLLEEINISAVAMAGKVAKRHGVLAAGDLCNTWEYNIEDPQGSARTIRPMFEEQTRWAVDGGVDLIIGETFSHLGEAMIALDVIKSAGLPSVITFIPLGPLTCDGYPWEDACKMLEDNGADVVGLNCGKGPATMLPILERIRKRVSGHVAALPVPYRTTEQQPTFHDLKLPGQTRGFPVALDPFQLTRFEMADFAARSKAMGINYLGVCCGGAPHHVRSMAEELNRTVPSSEFSPSMSLHPVLGDKHSTRDEYVTCFFGPVEE